MCALSRRQAQVLELIDTFTESKGRSPTIRELMQTLNLTSPASVHRHIQSLRKLGHLQQTARSWHNLKLSKATKSRPESLQQTVAIIGAISRGQKPELFAKTALIEVSESLVKQSDYTLYAFLVKDNSFEDFHMQQGDLLIVEAKTQCQEHELAIATSKQDGTQIARHPNLQGATIQGIIITLIRKY